MTSPEHSPRYTFPTSEDINRHTGYELRGAYDYNVFDEPLAKRSYKEHLGGLQEALGEDNVITSFYLNVDGKLQWGVFARPLPPEKAQNAASQHAARGRLATQETAELPRTTYGGPMHS